VRRKFGQSLKSCVRVQTGKLLISCGLDLDLLCVHWLLMVGIFFFSCGSSFWKNEDEIGGGLAGLGGDTEAHPYVSFTVNLV
jgi:hypothetical protein